MNFVDNYYQWIKALHYLAFISWMAGMFYLPRLFVYHSENKANEAFVSVVKIQEKRLYFFIQTPAMFVTLLSGIVMLVMQKDILMSQGYIHAKLTIALLVLFFHFDNGRFLRQLQNDDCKRSGRFFRIYNEIPTLLVIAIIVIMIIRPF